MTQSPSVDTTNALLHYFPVSPPHESQQVQKHISSLSTAPPPPPPSPHRDSGLGPLYAMRGVAYTHRMWTATKQVLAAHVRTHFHLTMGKDNVGRYEWA